MTLVALGLGVVIGAIATYLAMRVAPRIGLVAGAKEDRWHTTPTPVFGGLGLVVGLFVAGGGVSIEAPAHASILAGLTAGVLIAFGVGLLDDFRAMGLAPKLAGQLLAAAVVVGAGVELHVVGVAAADVALSIVFILATMNAVNLMDNMDGAAAGVVALSGVGLAIAAVIMDAGAAVSLLAWALVASCVGFLVWNAPMPRARTFMGDSGSLPLGLVLGALAIGVSNAAGGALPHRLAPFIVLSVLALDTATVAISRHLRGQRFFNGGKDHLSHRLVYRGRSERAAVGILVAASAFCAAVACLALALTPIAALLVELGTVATFAAVLLALIRGAMPQAMAPSSSVGV